ncbi:hypothetical protein EDD55_101173 [Varunaivibrio sulfuroxidans]|uniref:Uncharacterized protein n=2 Tax=Varunaivibrio sulfuroxidans TaxID=1773489 RepID=A0A4R3JG27_9PROT|nr:hypothetical protein EDD55_101173 [Varunaivibrio sulfuroxidans]
MDSRLLLERTVPGDRPTDPTARTAKRGAEFESRATTRGAAFSFSDFIDIINPLQHIPFISNLYRNLTGDTIRPGPRIVGDGLFGGPIGLVASILDAGVQQVTGEGLGTRTLSLLGLEPGDSGATAGAHLAKHADPGRAPKEDFTDIAVSDWARGEIAYREGLRAAANAQTPHIVGATAQMHRRTPSGAPPSTAPDASMAQIISNANQKISPQNPANTGGRPTAAMLGGVVQYEKAAQTRAIAIPPIVDVLN